MKRLVVLTLLVLLGVSIAWSQTPTPPPTTAVSFGVTTWLEPVTDAQYAGPR